ncbi:PRC-barrel domain protein [Desulfotomaculum nigrificans CO-1-SRB]|uniref:PRC-barrel domain protein n=1 Tax=Desulfotomaculum nigrificans (strain DSM 14880 / VKM B-2319 / CO-1-SRB) TaxID=868595 RepID=F6B4H6_DESCC|nr:PRC-barrel domain-containing protein [Desulfotomaculum nigrificans]AEF92999.1 PRC-barrel domain protein [Desulfotomaculum nigrificans CO-1-SRB]
MRKSKKYVGMPVISLAEGQQIGTVKGLVVDPVQKKVAALIIEQKGWFKEQKFAPYGKVCSIGKDAITIDQSTHVEKGASLPEILKLYKEKLNLIGCRVMAENGTHLGIVDEYFVEENTGAIVGLELSGSLLDSFMKGRVFLDISFTRTIGKEMVVTSNEAIDNLVKVDGGLQETVKTFKNSTSQFLENTLQKTKEISSKTKEELESKTKELGNLTKDLGESLNRQLDKVRGKDRSEPVEDPVVVQDLPPEAARGEDNELTRAKPTEDKVEVVDLPPEAQLTREEEQAGETNESAVKNGDETEVKAEDPSADKK